MNFDQLITDLVTRGDLSEKQASILRDIYREEMAKHGSDVEARRAVSTFLTKTPEERKQDLARAKAVILQAAAKKLGERKEARPSVPVMLKFLQAIVGLVLGAVAGGAAVFLLFYGTMFVIEALFGEAPRHVRVPVKGVLAAIIAPFAGALIGAIYGWKFDGRLASDRVRRFLDTSSVYDRAWLAWGAVWSGLILIAFTAFDPFERYRYRHWRDDDWLMLALLWFGPIVGGWVVVRLVRWVAAGARERHSPPPIE